MVSASLFKIYEYNDQGTVWRKTKPTNEYTTGSLTNLKIILLYCSTESQCSKLYSPPIETKLLRLCVEEQCHCMAGKSYGLRGQWWLWVNYKHWRCMEGGTWVGLEKTGWSFVQVDVNYGWLLSLFLFVTAICCCDDSGMLQLQIRDGSQHHCWGKKTSYLPWQY